MTSRPMYLNGEPHTIWYDYEDGPILDLYKLYLMRHRNGNLYLQGKLVGAKESPRVQMSRVIMNTPTGQDCHHKGHTLDNRRSMLSNIKLTDHRSLSNHARKKGNFIGVDWHHGKWRIRLQRKGGSYHYTGSFANELEAGVTYDREAVRIGKLSESINFPEEYYLRVDEIARGM